MNPSPVRDKLGDARLIRRMFSDIAPRYDFGNHLLSFQVDRLWRRRVAQMTAPLGASRILDVCCGTGDLAGACAKKLPAEARIVGCDFALPMLTIAKSKWAKRSRPPAIHLAAADALRLPFQDGVFDVVMVAFGLRNVVDHQAGLNEMARVIRPGGRMIVLEFTTPPNPLFRKLYLLYFKRILPVIARWGTGSAEYGYLPASVAEFPPPEETGKMMEKAGLRNVGWKLLTFGIAAIHHGVKS